MDGVKLTKAFADRAEYRGPGRCVYWDREDRGFGLRVYPSGRKAWVLSYRAGGRKRLVVLGRYDHETLTAVRRRAKKALVQVADGVVPYGAALGSTGRPGRLRGYCEAWLEEEGKVQRRSWREDDRRLRKHIYPGMGGRKLATITRRDCELLHANITARGPVEANRTLELLRRIFRSAEADGLMSENPASGSWRSKRGPGNRERSRTRYIRPEEFQAFCEAVEAEEDPCVRGAVWLLLLTTVRSASELLQLRWSDLDFDAGVMIVRRKKSEDDLTIPLSGHACAEFRNLPRDADNPYVFPGRTPPVITAAVFDAPGRASRDGRD